MMKKAKVGTEREGIMKEMERRRTINELHTACRVACDKGMMIGGTAGTWLMVCLVLIPLGIMAGGAINLVMVSYEFALSLTVNNIAMSIMVAALIALPVRRMSWNVSTYPLSEFECTENSAWNRFVVYAVKIAVIAVTMSASVLIALGGLMTTDIRTMTIWIVIKMIVALVWYKGFRMRAYTLEAEAEAYDW